MLFDPWGAPDTARLLFVEKAAFSVYNTEKEERNGKIPGAIFRFQACIAAGNRFMI